MSITLVTDSTADIPVELAAAFNIHVVPNILVIDGKSLEDGMEISRREFYERLPAMEAMPSTATASSGRYEELYRRLLAEGAEQILSIHAASKLSGIFNAASVAAQPFGEKVRVVDSQHITLGLGFQVLKAAEAAARNEKIEAILDLLENTQPHVRVIAMLDTLEYVRRSGRVSWARARLGNLLRIKPFVSVRYGEVFSLGEARTRRKGIARLREIIHEHAPFERFAILHTNAEADARKLLGGLDIALPHESLVVNVTPVIGTHVGPNGLGFAAVVSAA